MDTLAVQFNSVRGRIAKAVAEVTGVRGVCQFLTALILMATGGCQRDQQLGARQLVVHKATTPIQLDGNLNEPDWQQAKAVTLDIPLEFQQQGQSLEEPGTARLLWDDRFLYIAFEFVDSDLIALGKEGEEGQQLSGDLAEIFLKQPEQTWYWELHVTPTGYITQNWNVGRGRWGLKDYDRRIGPQFVEVAPKLQGTLNNWRDRDQGWTVEVAIPFEKLDRFGELSNGKANWTILLGRYNYTRYRRQGTGPELSSWPILSRPFYHLVEEYAQLKLVP